MEVLLSEERLLGSCRIAGLDGSSGVVDIVEYMKEMWLMVDRSTCRYGTLVIELVVCWLIDCVSDETPATTAISLAATL